MYLYLFLIYFVFTDNLVCFLFNSKKLYVYVCQRKFSFLPEIIKFFYHIFIMLCGGVYFHLCNMKRKWKISTFNIFFTFNRHEIYPYFHWLVKEPSSLFLKEKKIYGENFNLFSKETC